MASLDKFLADHPAVNRQGDQKYTTAVWGGVSQEYDALKAQVKIVSSDSESVDNISGDMLDELILRFTGIPRATNQLDNSRLKTLFAFYRRSGRKSWATPHAIIGAYLYYFPRNRMFLLENAVETNLVTYSGFEEFEQGVVTGPFGDWTPSGSAVEIVSAESLQGSRCVKLSGTGNITQSITLASGCSIVTTPYRGAARVTIKRQSDNYYYDFAKNTWSSTEKHLSLINETEEYKIHENPVFVESQTNITIQYSVDSAGVLCYLDNLTVGPKPSYSFIKVIVSTTGQNGEFMNNWPGTTDPVSGANYDYATYFGIDFIGGDGGGVPTSYYQTVLDIIKPSGVKALFGFVGRE